MRDAEAAVVWDAHLGGWPVGADRHRVAPDRPLRADARRRPGAVDLGHAVPEVARRRSRGRSTPPAAAGRWWCWRTWRLRRLAGVDAPVAARVRRRDRPRDRQLPRPDRLLRHLPLPRRRVRGLLAAAERRLRGDRGGGRARVGDRRLGGGRRGVHARRDDATRQDPRVAEIDERIEDGRGRRAPAPARRARDAVETVRAEKMGELAAKFDPIHSIQRAVEVGWVSGIVAASDLRPYLVDAIERGMQKAADRARVAGRSLTAVELAGAGVRLAGERRPESRDGPTSAAARRRTDAALVGRHGGASSPAPAGPRSRSTPAGTATATGRPTATTGSSLRRRPARRRRDARAPAGAGRRVTGRDDVARRRGRAPGRRAGARAGRRRGRRGARRRGADPRLHERNPDGFARSRTRPTRSPPTTPTARAPRNLDGLRKNLRRGEDGRWRWHWDPKLCGSATSRSAGSTASACAPPRPR